MTPENHFDFLQAVWMRRPVYTYVFLGVNIAIFLLMALAGGSMNQTTLMAFGVKSNPEIARGEWWRFLTPIFIHIGLLHLAFNSYALWVVGPQVEKLYGPARFVILYVLTGVAGVAGSYFYHPESISAGASGAIFGLFGVLLVFGFRYRDSIPPFFKRAVGVGVLPVILINLVIGFSIPAIDNSAHIAGLLAGAGLAAVIPFQKPGDETAGVFKATQAILLAAVVVCFYQVGKTYDGPRLSVRNLGGGLTQILGTSSPMGNFVDAINGAQQAFQSSSRDLQAGRTDHLETLKAGVAKSIDELRKVPSLDSTADGVTAALLRVMQEQYDIIEDVQRAGVVTFGHTLRLRENTRAYDEASTQLSTWVQQEGKRYGIAEKNVR